ncbi:IS1182 family transposase [Youngiibacter multivorans]|uniref:Transposase n=1 Tax=Youngiibacter multivorans TaxID=937251 RepID=A0ABS4G2R8_9CLOT|nr:IS1182 family transposase [Youngiibacter multivorans]MBP1918837.1 transposase [Youngiibacter multivorans]
MLSKKSTENREQIQFLCLDDLVPKDHILREVDRSMDFSFIYELVEDLYSEEKGRPSLDPVMLIKIPMIQTIFGIKSMRQTIKDIEVNLAYRWFLGLSITDAVPHFSTFGKNYTRRFKPTEENGYSDLFHEIFSKILEESLNLGLISKEIVFVDSTHIKANANRNKIHKEAARKAALFYEEELWKEIQEDRVSQGKKPFESDDDNPGGSGNAKKELEVTKSKSDPESGLFHKGPHKEVFAYMSQTACDANGWILEYSVHPGNDHDSRTFVDLYNKLPKDEIEMLVGDAGYKTPAIARLLNQDHIIPVLPYKRPMTKEGFFRKHEYKYDQFNDCYICPNSKFLLLSTTNREGYREYKSDGKVCAECPHLSRCTESKSHVKVILRHIWEAYLEWSEKIRLTPGIKDIYNLRKQTIERLFGTAKENHNLRYTRMMGKAKMEMKVGLTFACMNLLKLTKMKRRMGLLEPIYG